MSTNSPEFLERIIANWEGSPEVPSAVEVCQQHPEIWENRSFVVKLAYEEFRLRKKRGEEVVPQEFCKQFGGCQHAVGRMLSVHVAMEQHPSWLAELSEDLGDDDDWWPVAGKEFLRFQILREIGRGGLARVYLAQEQIVGNRLVVLKVSTRDTGEARIMGRLQHPGIMPVHQVDFDPLTGLHVVVMPFLGRTTLYDVLIAAFPNRQGPGPSEASFIKRMAEEGCDGLETSVLAGSSIFQDPGDTYLNAVVGIGLHLAEALAYTHERGVLHRDLKPSNVLVTPQGHALLMDFNLSARTDGPGLLAGGTIPYMPPELLSALSGTESVRLASDLPPFGSTWNTISKDNCATNDLRTDSTNREFGGWIACADPRSDLFSWGVILYELLTGQLPFGEPDSRQQVNWQAEWVLKRQLDRRIERHSANQHIPDKVFQLVRRCLSIEPESRPANAAEVVAALREIVAPATPSASPVRAQEQTNGTAKATSFTRLRSVRRLRWLAGMAGAAAAVAVGYAAWFGDRPQEPVMAPVASLEAPIIPSATPLSTTPTALPTTDSVPLDPVLEPRLVAVDLTDGERVRIAARELMAEAKWQEALVKLQEAADLSGESGENFALQAYCTLQDDHYQSGSSLGKSALQANYATPAVLNNYGYALLKTKRYGMARRMLEDAARLAPEDAVIRHNLCVLELAEGHFDEAVRQVRLALEFDPAGSVELHWNAAIAYAEASATNPDLEESAVRHLEAAVRAGLDRETLSRGPNALRKVAQIVEDKNVRCVLASHPESSPSRLIHPDASPATHVQPVSANRSTL